MEKHEFIVLEPPTSSGVLELAYNMMSTGGLLPLMIQKSKESVESITMHLNQQNGNSDGSTSLAGRLVDSNVWVELHISSDKQSPATGYIE